MLGSKDTLPESLEGAPGRGPGRRKADPPQGRLEATAQAASCWDLVHVARVLGFSPTDFIQVSITFPLQEEGFDAETCGFPRVCRR